MSVTPVDINGVIALDSAAQVQAAFPGQTLTPTATFSFPWNGLTLSFTQGESQVVMPDVLAALTAAGAPFTQP